MVDVESGYARQAEDFVLLRRYGLDSDPETFRALCRRHLNFVYAVCCRELPSQESAEDATQAVFITLAKKVRHLRPDTELNAWLFRVAVLTCRGIRRAEARRLRLEKTAGEPRQTEEHDPLLYMAIADLPAADRTAVVLKFLEERTYQEVATVLGITEDAARMRIQRILERLRRKLGYAPAFLPLVWIAPSERLYRFPIPARPRCARWVALAAGVGIVGIGSYGWIAGRANPSGNAALLGQTSTTAAAIKATDAKSRLLPFYAHVQIFEDGKLAFEGDTWRTAESTRWHAKMGPQEIEAEVKNGILRSIANPFVEAPPNVACVIVGPPEQRIVETDAFEAALIELPVYVHNDPPLKRASLEGGKREGNRVQIEADGDRHYTAWLDPAHGDMVSKLDYKVGDFRFVASVKAWQNVGKGLDVPREVVVDGWYKDKKSNERIIKISGVKVGPSVEVPAMPRPLKNALVMDNVRHTVYRIDPLWRRVTKEIPTTNGDIKGGGF